MTKDCWEIIEKELEKKPKALSNLRGLFEDEFIEIGEDDPIISTVRCVNYLADLKPVILVTRRRKEEYTNKEMRESITIWSFEEILNKISNDMNFVIWKSIALKKMQKFKGSPEEA